MPRARVLLEKKLGISDRFRVELRVFEIAASKKYPQGLKARFVLLDLFRKVPLLVVDNHAPFGFHAHTRLPEEPGMREVLKVRDHLEALDHFWSLVAEVLSHENQDS